MLSAGRFCHIHNESVSESHSSLLLGLNGERWRCNKNVVITHRGIQGSVSTVSALFLKAGYTL